MLHLPNAAQVVLLRNRDRLSLLWPPVFDHLCAIIRGKGVEGTLVAAAAVGLLRLCQRLLPCKPEAAEPLLRGLQLVPSLDPEVGYMYCHRPFVDCGLYE
jgi:hypothetical protein